jgi:hypothetical protein
MNRTLLGATAALLLPACGVIVEENTVLDMNDLAEHVAFLQFGDDPADQTAFVTAAVFDESADGAPVDLTLTITNTGPTDAAEVTYSEDPEKQMAAPFSFKDGTYPGTGGDCGTEVTAGESCTIVLTFDPDDGLDQTFEDDFTITYDNGLVEFLLVVALAGVATNPTP